MVGCLCPGQVFFCQQNAAQNDMGVRQRLRDLPGLVFADGCAPQAFSLIQFVPLPADICQLGFEVAGQVETPGAAFFVDRLRQGAWAFPRSRADNSIQGCILHNTPVVDFHH